jgi:2-polyprenyl-3-methyl-5-hydroxy-6-metoxy-1,4-benzoquinol methylase
LDPEFSQHYRELYENHWWFRAREELIIKCLRREQPPDGWKSILDVGCGDGLFFDKLMQFGDVEGVEPAEQVIRPNNPFRRRIHVGAFDASFQPRKQYSLILMLDVLEHLPAPVEALRHAISLLQPGGSLLITVPAFRTLWTSHDVLNHHFTRYTKASFGRVAKEAGMKILQTRYMFFSLYLPKLAVRAKEYFLGSQPAIPGLPSPGFNRLLLWASSWEEKLLGKLPIPLGSSLLVFGGASASSPPTRVEGGNRTWKEEEELQGTR